MLLSTFQHLQGIGAKTELALWRAGIKSWSDFEMKRGVQLSIFGNAIDNSSVSPLTDSRKALENEDATFFAQRLPPQEYYRIAASFPEKTLFLDIETTGLSRYYDYITIIGWSMGGLYGVYIKGTDDSSLREALSVAKVIVTFNGTLFDIPFLRQEFPDITVPITHVDLRFLSKRVNLSGGQKSIEQQLDFKRPKHLVELAGESAPLLWHQYLRGDIAALRLLLAYNQADLEGMRFILGKVIAVLVEQNEFPLHTSISRLFSSQVDVSSTLDVTNSSFQIPPFSGKVGPIITLKNLTTLIDDLRVVGIDLTGSESRPSGWCLLDGDIAMTSRLATDDEIISETLAACPHLVSIDSPLSLPVGRTVVTDDDPNRKAYGITRYCERVLKKRGINVYPSLIRSMQNLTARGIRLAHRFRELGVPVIESYPGAAQDIINIPRKRASLAMLKTGLVEFGIRGDFVDQPVSHDELDAITSALVGVFFWSGKFEALGNEDEEYLIIPDIQPDTNVWQHRKIVGLSGLIGSGKTSVGQFLRNQCFVYTRFSLVLEELLRKLNIVPSREALQQIGEEVNKNPGQRWLCNELVRGIPLNSNAVIDGLRFPEDHAFMVEKFGPNFLHIHINTSHDLRLKRYTSSRGSTDEFIQAVAHPVEDCIASLSDLAHVKITNDDTLEELIAKVNHIVFARQDLTKDITPCP